jgi:hypothetical protein
MWQAFRKRDVASAIAGAALLVSVSVVMAAPAYGQSGSEIDRTRTDELVKLINGDRDTFGGASFDERAGIATIRYAVGAGAAEASDRLGRLTGDPRKGPHRWRIVMIPVKHSLSDLDTVRQRVVSDPDWAKVAAERTSEWYIDIPRNLVAVGLSKVTPELVEAAQREFGELVSLHTQARAPRASRTDDFEPWAAGIRINVAGGGGCTSGFVIRTTATPIQRRHVTAGHCGPLGAAVTNNGDPVGSVVTRTLAQNGIDVATIGGRTYEAWMYTQGPTSNVGQSIRGSKVSYVGLGVCTNGATTGENCNARVTAIDACFTYSDGITTCFLDRVESTNGSTIVQPGDSGGPVIAYDAGGLKIVGTIIGPGGTVSYFHWSAYLIRSGWQVDYVP